MPVENRSRTAAFIMPRGSIEASRRKRPASSSINGSIRGLFFLNAFDRKRFLATLREMCSRSTASLRTSRTNLSTLFCIAGPATRMGARGFCLRRFPSRQSLARFSSRIRSFSSAHSSERRGTSRAHRSTSSAARSFRGMDPIDA